MGRGAAGSRGRRAGLGAEAGAGPAQGPTQDRGGVLSALSPHAGSVLSRSRVSVSTQRALAGGRGRRTCSWVTASTNVRKSAL